MCVPANEQRLVFKSACGDFIFTDISVHWLFQATSEVGSAGLYLEDYFEEQLKIVYPDKIFPGGREEQMIPPLEDEIDEEEEQTMEEGMAPIEDDKPADPLSKGIPPVEEDTAHLEEGTAPEMEENPRTEEKQTDMSEKRMDLNVAKAEEGELPPEEVKQDKKTPSEEVKSSPAAESATTNGATGSSPKKEENPQLPTDKTADLSESQAKESAPANTAKEVEG